MMSGKNNEENEMTNEDKTDQQVKSPSGIYIWKWIPSALVLSGWFYYLFMLFRAGENLDKILLIVLLIAVFGQEVIKSAKE